MTNAQRIKFNETYDNYQKAVEQYETALMTLSTWDGRAGLEKIDMLKREVKAREQYVRITYREYLKQCKKHNVSPMQLH